MAFITVAGENQIAAKQGAAQTLNITHFVLAYIAGLGAEPVNRIEAMPAAGNIKATLPVTSSGYVNGNQVVYSLVMDSSLGDYDFNWVGLKDADGVLIACTYTPMIQKRKTTGAIPGNNLTRNFLIAFSGIQATTAIAVPAETWQIDFNARLWGIDERERLSNYDIYGHEGFFGDGWKVVRDGATTTYNVLDGVGYVGGVRIASAVVQPVTVAGPPKSIWVDVSLQGDISDVSAVTAFVIDAVVHADYADANGFNHYVTKIADIAADGSVTDMRPLIESVADHEAKSNPHPQYATDVQSQLFTESGSWLCPDGVTVGFLTGAAGGGGGGGGSNGGGSGSGGGGGQLANRVKVALIPGTTYAITIGAGGVGGGINSNGTSGGATSFGALLTLTGGGFGASASNGATGGSSVNNQYGGAGTQASILHASGATGGGVGGGAGGPTTGAPGANGIANTGGGGGGGHADGVAALGGTGGSGYLLLEY